MIRQERLYLMQEIAPEDGGGGGGGGGYTPPQGISITDTYVRYDYSEDRRVHRLTFNGTPKKDDVFRVKFVNAAGSTFVKAEFIVPSDTTTIADVVSNIFGDFVNNDTSGPRIYGEFIESTNAIVFKVNRWESNEGGPKSIILEALVAPPPAPPVPPFTSINKVTGKIPTAPFEVINSFDYKNNNYANFISLKGYKKFWHPKKGLLLTDGTYDAGTMADFKLEYTPYYGAEVDTLVLIGNKLTSASANPIEPVVAPVAPPTTPDDNGLLIS